MPWIVAWLFLSAVVAVAANTRGRSWPIWLVLSIVISPLLTGLLLLALPNNSFHITEASLKRAADAERYRYDPAYRGRQNLITALVAIAFISVLLMAYLNSLKYQ